MTPMIFVIDGQQVSKERIDAWEMNRIDHEYQFLTKKGFHFSYEFPQLLARHDVAGARQEMAAMKAAQNPDTFRQLLLPKYPFGQCCFPRSCPVFPATQVQCDGYYYPSVRAHAHRGNDSDQRHYVNQHGGASKNQLSHQP